MMTMLAIFRLLMDWTVGPYNSNNSIIVPNDVWANMNLQFSVSFISAILLGIFAVILTFAVIATPASSMIMARLKGGRAIIGFRRDGTYQIKPAPYRRGFLFPKDGIHQVIPGAMHHSKGVSLGACWEESGTALPIEMAAAMQMLGKIGIPDAETIELFNFYLKDPDRFNELVADAQSETPTASKAFELIPYADQKGTFYELLAHAKSVYAIADNVTLLSRFQSIKRSIPQIDSLQTARKFQAWRYPYWWNNKKGLVTNVLGTMLNWSEIKNFQIYHLHPAHITNMVDSESDRKARKIGRDKTLLIIVAGVIICGVIVVGVIAYKMLS